jgi:hypothetical protein
VRRGILGLPPRRPVSAALGRLKLIVLGRKLNDTDVSGIYCILAEMTEILYNLILKQADWSAGFD